MAKPTTKPKAEDKSIRIAQHEKLTKKITIRDFPWSDKQKEFMALINDKGTTMVLCKGPAGTSKTLCAVYCALHALNDKHISQLTYVRTIVESSVKGMGYVKGDFNEKMHPYLQPLIEKLDELLPTSEITQLLNDENVVGAPVGYLRGRQLNVSHIIVDEAQNLTPEEALLTITRCGKRSKMILIGDTKQADIKRSSFEGIYDLFDNDEAKTHGIYTFKFGLEDIFRNPMLQYVIEQFDKLKV